MIPNYNPYNSVNSKCPYRWEIAAPQQKFYSCGHPYPGLVCSGVDALVSSSCPSCQKCFDPLYPPLVDVFQDASANAGSAEGGTASRPNYATGLLDAREFPVNSPRAKESRCSLCASCERRKCCSDCFTRLRWSLAYFMAVGSLILSICFSIVDLKGDSSMLALSPVVGALKWSLRLSFVAMTAAIVSMHCGGKACPIFSIPFTFSCFALGTFCSFWLATGNGSGFFAVALSVSRAYHGVVIALLVMLGLAGAKRCASKSL